jgi:hypothetical protein
VYDELKGVAVV